MIEREINGFKKKTKVADVVLSIKSLTCQRTGLLSRKIDNRWSARTMLLLNR